MKLEKFTDYSKYFTDAKTALRKKKKFTDYRGLNTKHNYSSFWMDDKWDSASKFSGLGGLSTSNDTVKLVKLANYRRAITNFVKIVTNKDIPVLWAGSDSYTDGKSITLSTDIKDNNFDVTVGLALHEASHIILTDFSILVEMAEGKNELLEALKTRVDGSTVLPFSSKSVTSLFKDVLNWIEDRRIDYFIFNTSPGYKAYYHKLYDAFWNSKDVTKAFLSKAFCDSSEIDNYLFHITNMMNPSFVPKAMPGLDKIVSIVDLKNINRLKNTRDAAQVAYDVCVIVLDETKKGLDKKMNGESLPSMPSAGNNGNVENGDDLQLTDLTASEIAQIQKGIEQQRQFLRGETKKKRSTKKMQRQLEVIAKQAIDIQTVGDGVEKRTVLLYDYTSNTLLLQRDKLMEDVLQAQEKRDAAPFGSIERKAFSEKVENLRKSLGENPFFERTSFRESRLKAIQEGIEMGSLLGKKLQLHNESRERIDTRLRNGKIDAKRLAHAGYGIEGIFKQIHVDKYKKANLHISLDGSGSMNGNKWENTIKMTMAIAKAATYTQNINIQVTIRVTEHVSGRGDTPVNLFVYDSRKNKLMYLVTAFRLFEPDNMTPEGLCFEAMIKKNQLIESNNDVDSYFLNLSDGEPGCDSYHGEIAINHTKRQVDYMKNVYKMSILSFFITSTPAAWKEISEELQYVKLKEKFFNESSGRAFQRMYGKDATVVPANNTIQIAKELNKKFLSRA